MRTVFLRYLDVSLQYLTVSPRISLHLIASPRISPYLPVSARIRPYLVSPGISRYLPVSPGIPPYPAISRRIPPYPAISRHIPPRIPRKKPEGVGRRENPKKPRKKPQKPSEPPVTRLLVRDDAWPAREQAGADAARTKTRPRPTAGRAGEHQIPRDPRKRRGVEWLKCDEERRGKFG